jgi:curved DNA-binding protein CbpA
MDNNDPAIIEFNKLEFNLYELLNLPIDSTIEEIKKRFKKLVKKFHPDKITEIEAKIYYNLTIANRILTNEQTKLKYDNWLLKSHKSHASLKETFKDELNIIKEFFPQTKEEAEVDFQKKFADLGKRHGDFVEDNRNLSNIYKDKQKERGNINITKENFSNMDEFNNKFSDRKKNGEYCKTIVKRTGDIMPFSFKSGKYSELKDFDNVYSKDDTIKYAFELLPSDDSKIPHKTMEQKLNEYNNMTQNINTKNFNIKDLNF